MAHLGSIADHPLELEDSDHPLAHSGRWRLELVRPSPGEATGAREDDLGPPGLPLQVGDHRPSLACPSRYVQGGSGTGPLSSCTCNTSCVAWQDVAGGREGAIRWKHPDRIGRLGSHDLSLLPIGASSPEAKIRRGPSDSFSGLQ